MYTIKDLAEGRCTILNDGTVEQLRAVIKAAFPNIECIPNGSCKYYCKDNSINHLTWDAYNSDFSLPIKNIVSVIDLYNQLLKNENITDSELFPIY